MKYIILPILLLLGYAIASIFWCITFLWHLDLLKANVAFVNYAPDNPKRLFKTWKD